MVELPELVAAVAEVELEALHGQRVAEVADAGGRGHAGDGRGAEQLAGQAERPGPARARPRCATGTLASWMASASSAMRSGDTTAPLLFICTMSACAPSVSAAVDGLRQIVDHHVVDQAADLDDVDRAPRPSARRPVCVRRAPRCPGASRPTALSRSPPRAMASLRTSGPPKGTSGSAAVLRLLPAGHRGRQGRRREDHGNGCDGHRRSPRRPAGARRSSSRARAGSARCSAPTAPLGAGRACCRPPRPDSRARCPAGSSRPVTR